MIRNVNSSQQGYILVVGKMFPSLKKYLNEHEYNYLLLKDKRLIPDPSKRLKHTQAADYSTKDSLLYTASKLPRPAAILAIYENYIEPAAWLCEYFGLPGLSTEAARACTDKETMRHLFALAPENISPDFVVVNNEQDLHDFSAKHSFPLILKPANLAKSLLVTKALDLEELLSQYRAALEKVDTIYAKYAPNKKPKLIVEEFLEGTIHSVDAFVDAKGTPHVLEEIVDYQTGYDIGYDDNFHYSRILPSQLSESTKKQFRKVAALGCRALGLTSSPAHIEIIVTATGPKIVEIGARNGGYRERMHRLANGIDIPGNAIALAMGKPLQLAADKHEPCAVLELFPKQAGIFDSVARKDELDKLPSLTYFSQKASFGEVIGKAADGFKAAAIIILHNVDAQQFKEDLAFINNHVHIVTK